ncbi:GNAT family N-acetyltransferase [Streptococcus henryi]|uniref:GNAT family N-acetyltransferase n=1 Tax=Streptococcus henryi TaxID=439219 RepID=UPI00037F8C3A|nr:GNAT family N-acetyltransferase [Streptococcus henryi]
MSQTKDRILLLRDALTDETRAIYLSMLPEYQQSYADYVYSADKEITINKRIKNLEKSFGKLLTEVYYYLTPMTQTTAEEIANTWKYQPPYDFYDMTADPEDYAELISSQARGHHYFQVIRNGALVGFASFFENGAELTVGLGMKPDYVGQGWGRPFFQAIEDFAREKYSFQKLVLEVAAFNQRAQKLYHNMGFEAQAHFQQKTNGGIYDFVRMEKSFQK